MGFVNTCSSQFSSEVTLQSWKLFYVQNWNMSREDSVNISPANFSHYFKKALALMILLRVTISLIYVCTH